MLSVTPEGAAKPVGPRVLMTTDAVGGIWTYGLDLASGLAAQGRAVTLAVLGPGLDPARRRQAEAAHLCVVDTGLPPEWLAEDVATIARTAGRVATLARDMAADLVHLNHPALAGLVPFPCPVVGVAHSCVASWWEAVRGGPLPEDFAWRTDVVARGYAALDRLIAPSRAFAEATRRLYGFATLPTVVHNGRARLEFPGFPGLPSASVFSAGRLWDEAKGLATLDRAAAQLDVPVEAAGPTRGPNRAAVVLAQVKTLGALSEAAIVAHLAARPIYASPALYEPFGLAVVEAAQASCALVLSDIPTFRELWDEAAEFIPPHDADALAAIIRSLTADPSRRDGLGRRAAARAARFTLDAMVDGTRAVHDDALADARLRPNRDSLVRPSAA